MVLKINNTKFEFANSVDLTLKYDSVASEFSFSVYFDPFNPIHKKAFLPGSYPIVTIEDEGQLLLTGTIMNYKFSSSSEDSLVGISGYSKCGVLEDCEIPKEAYPLQAIGLNLKQITEKIIKPFGLNLIVDSSVASRAGQTFISSTASDSDKARSYIAKLAGQKQIMLTHDEKGNLVLTEAKINQEPIYDFSEGMPGIEISFDFDGQKMHSSVTMQKQATKRGKGNAGVSTINNPYVLNGFRPKTDRQRNGNDVDTSLAARNIFSDELLGMPLTIKIDRWTLNGKMIRPNTIITVLSPRCYIYKKTKFFIQSVQFSEDESSKTATLTCVLPECFSSAIPKNIFL